MNEKILVNVYLPAAYKNFEVYIPTQALVRDVQNTLAEILTDLSDGLFIRSDQTILIDRSTGSILNINARVGDLDLGNGSRLMLI